MLLSKFSKISSFQNIFSWEMPNPWRILSIVAQNKLKWGKIGINISVQNHFAII